MKNGYKVLVVNPIFCKDAGHSCSFSLGSTMANAALVFYKNKTLAHPRANCGPLAVFDTYEHARLFYNKEIRYNLNLILVDCLFEEITEQEVRDICQIDCPVGEALLWYVGGFSYMTKDALPPGTRLAKSVICYW